MSRSAFIKTALAAFLAGIAVTVIGIKIWISQPAQENLRHFIELDGFHPNPFGPPSRSLMWSSEPASPSPSWQISGYSFALTPLEPILMMTAEDIESICADYAPGAYFQIDFQPTPKFAQRLEQLAEQSLNEKGVGTTFLLMSNDYRVRAVMTASTDTIREYHTMKDNYRTEFSKLLLSKLTFEFEPYEYRSGIRILADWAHHTDIPVSTCAGPVIKEGALWDFIDRNYYEGTAERIFKKSEPAPDEYLMPDQE